MVEKINKVDMIAKYDEETARMRVTILGKTDDVMFLLSCWMTLESASAFAENLNQEISAGFHVRSTQKDTL